MAEHNDYSDLHSFRLSGKFGCNIQYCDFPDRSYLHTSSSISKGTRILSFSFNDHKGTLLCLLIATVGGMAASYVNIPLPYIIGSMAASMAAAMMRMPIGRPTNIFIIPMRATLGVLIGSAVSPALFDNIEAILATAIFVPLYVFAASASGMFYYLKIAKFDREQAFFCSLPGGLLIMTAMADDTGIDIKRISLAHVLRIVLVVVSLPFLAGIFMGIEAMNTPRISIGIVETPLLDLSLLIGAAVVGLFVAKILKLPAGQIIGPLFVSAALHLGDVTSAKPPQELINAAQIILGAYIGSRFIGENLSIVRSSIFHSIGHVTVMLSLSIGLAFFLYQVLDVPLMNGVLSFAPGGLPENSLIAFGLGLDVGFIATVQVCRLLFISFMAPIIYPRIKHLLH